MSGFLSFRAFHQKHFQNSKPFFRHMIEMNTQSPSQPPLFQYPPQHNHFPPQLDSYYPYGWPIPYNQNQNYEEEKSNEEEEEEENVEQIDEGREEIVEVEEVEVIEEIEEEIRFELTEEAAEFFAESYKRRKKLQKERELQQREEKRKQKEDRETQLISQQMEKESLARKLYGDSAYKVLAFEAKLNEVFDSDCDKNSPVLWPHLPINC